MANPNYAEGPMRQEQERLIEFLQPLRFADIQSSISRKIVPETGQWFFASSKVMQFLEGSSLSRSQTLVCFGMPGSGKTYLTAQLVEQVMMLRRRQSNTSIGLAYIYLDFRQPDQTPERILASIIYQLVLGVDAVPSALKQAFDRGVSRGRVSPDLYEVSGLLSQVVLLFEKVFVIIDALDELPELHREVVVMEILKVQERHGICFFATSRHIPGIIDMFEGFPTLFIRAAEEDIRCMVEYRLAQSGNRLGNLFQKKPGLRDQIANSIIREADGMFLYPRLRLDELDEITTERGVKNFLATSKTPLIQYTYELIMNEIMSGPKDDFELAKKALAWTTFAKRPLQAEELAIGLSIMPGQSRIEQDDLISLEGVLSTCKGLVEQNTVSGEILLVHFSVRTFLLENREKWLPEGETDIAQSCLTYLCFDAFSTGFCPSDVEFEMRLASNRLYDYASKYWGEHFPPGAVQSERDTLALLMNNNKVEAAVQAMQVSKEKMPDANYSQRFIRQMTGLHLAAHFGLTSAVHLLLQSGHDPIPKDAQNRTPLLIATKGDHEGIIKILATRDRITYRLLAQSSDKSLLKVLLRVAGQDIRDYRRRTPIHIAVVQNDIELINIAINAGVGINATDNDGSTAMMLVVRLPNPNKFSRGIIKKLLRKGADTTGVTYNDWIRIFSKPGKEGNIVELMETAGEKRVKLRTLLEVGRAISRPPLGNQRRLFIFKDSSDWPTGIPPNNPQLASSKLVHGETDAENAETISHWVLVDFWAIETIDTPSKAVSQDVIGVSWTTTPVSDNGKERWLLRDHFSTLPDGSIPGSGAAFVEGLILHLKRRWLKVCDGAEINLQKYRGKVLKANGGDLTLIGRLLTDAQKWIQLRSILKDQAISAKAFRERYSKHDYDDNAIDRLGDTIDLFSREVNDRITKLDEISQTLIEISFNLTSINEAVKSTSTNRIHIPSSYLYISEHGPHFPINLIRETALLTAQGVFGMNINVLTSNPQWWWYLVFAGITTTITLSVWLIFKRYKNLEYNVQKKFSWLVGDPDEEMGWGPYKAGKDA
ncbi:hypothetical protein VTL71DRAFT_14225 [Oculimacula yallundae]|uniref:Nephrocystin 3-like N-terminal domain-containing protein n=1 Tax=Oculimacula yallundae TaxID=86028 RepID=A0ABR4CJ82_9HELO